MSFLSEQQIKLMGFKFIGENVYLSDKASFYNCSNISIGNNVRIDDFCVLSAGRGGIEIGNYIHIGVYSSLIGSGQISLLDFSNISSKVSIYSSNDDYSGEWMTNPMVPQEFTNVDNSNVAICKHVIIGSGSIVLPGVTLEEGVAVGALSLVSKNCDAFGIYSGVPAKRIKERKNYIKQLEAMLRVF
ncbi:galactoside O-acetyltransferase [Idiomarina loihiensis]|jgi:galactoside O-acetyltransferase|uniref:acyltransferase n=1 Tax=Idiomarina TaxID=135575 RepID=UPI000D719E2E|nr:MULTISPECIES: acyltransferase [Idiomarina]PWW37686.1 galactoside O-acetyltransferase [Idiomarina loihiensis]TDP47407.1 galactoside O-acetyltransferase [Idiomarina loihiensis]TDS23148.1 galactoside O-acetyltransferase [Idiomarina sp. H2]